MLDKTLGVPLFQEQAMKIAIVAAGFTPEEADRLRRAMATFKRVGTIGSFEKKMIDGMIANGYDARLRGAMFQTDRRLRQLWISREPCGELCAAGLCLGWMKCRYPDAFCASLLNAQPMGFYAPSQIVRDAREHGVEVGEVDVNLSYWDSTLEEDALGRRSCPQASDEGAPATSEARA